MNFNSVYDIALDILDKVGGDVTKAYDSAYSVALAILGEIGGDITKKFDSVYSIMAEIYRVRFGETFPAVDSIYSIAKKINEDLGDQTAGYDSTYSILVDVSENPYLIGHEFSIVTDSANTVIINGEEITSGVFPIGTTITWSVSRTGYVSQSGTYVMGNEDYSIEVALVLEQHTFTIIPTPGDATVTINGEERSSITADYGTAITWSVEKEHYVSQSGSLVLTSDVTESISLALVQHTFSIVTAAENTVVINGEERTSITADYGTTITWSVSREHYVTQSGSFTLTSNSTETITLVLQQFTFTINPTPVDAVVTINGQVRSFLTADYGTAITWSVERTGYTSQTGSYTLTQDHTESVSLVINQYTFTIVPVPSDAVVTINGETRTSITADYGTIINWSVSKTGYTTQSGTETLTETYSMEIDLSVSNFTFTIEATPVDAVVTINGETRTSLTAPYGTAITWSVSKSHYVTQNGSYTLTGDHYETVDLVLEQHTFSISTDVANTVVINGEQRTSITADYGTTITWSVSREHYVTQSGTFTLTADDSESITLVLQQFTFSITTDASNTVIINGSERSSITADWGTAITWSVSKSHYVTQNGSLTLTADASETVTLVLETHTFSITTAAENTVIINGEQRTSLTADYGTTITWSVSREHYVSQNGSLTLTADASETVTLAIMTFSFTINPTPADAVVTINGSARSSITVDYGTAITWSVAKTGYVTQNGSLTLDDDTTMNIVLILEQFTFTINPTPADAVVTINGQVRSSLTADYGTAISWSVAKTGYVTQSDTETLTGDTTRNVTLEEEALDYLAFDILSDGDIIWKMYNSNATPTTIEYRKNNGSWNSITSYIAGVIIPVETGDVLEFRGDNDAYCNINSNGYNCFGVDSGATFNARGNIMSLIDSDDFDNLTTLPVVGQNFRSLFQGCTGLIDASQLELPATTLAGSCYRSMFYGCTGLVAAPALPATTLVDNCYKYMFRDCDITTAPALPATTVVESCYANMFQGCTSITTAPALPATTLAKQCYEYMFSGCSSLNYIKCLATDISATNCTRNWVSSVAATGTFIKDPNMSSWTTGTGGIPTGWTAIDYASDTFTINPTPADATVVINGVERSSYTGMGGDVVTWSVSRTEYATQTGSYILDGTAHIENVTLSPENVTLTFNKGAADVKLVVNGEYLGTSAATHTITVDPGTPIHWEAYRAGYETKKGDFTATSNRTVSTSLSTAKFIKGYTVANNTITLSIYNTATGTYDPLTMNYGVWDGSKRTYYSTETALTNYNYQTTFQKTNMGSCQEIKLENIGSTITANNGITSMTGYTSNPIYLSLDGCRAASMASILAGGTSNPQYVYLNNWNPSSITNLQSALGMTTNEARISARMSASTDATTPKNIADYPARLKELHMNCWESIPTPAVITNGDTSYTGSVLMIFNVLSGYAGPPGYGGYDGNKNHIYNLMKSAEVDVYAYGWSNENLTKLMNTFKIQSVCNSYIYYNGEYDMSGAGVIRIHINDHQYYEWKLETEYPSVSSFTFNTSSTGTKCYYNCSQWTLVDTNV